MRPALLVIAGANGAGKTTITERLRRDQAARWSAARREELLEARAGIAFETVFSADDKLDFVQRAKSAGYFIRISIDDVEARLCARARDGQLAKIYGELPEWVADAIEGLPRSLDFVDLREE
jgi:predicted ABC-type ATPase